MIFYFTNEIQIFLHNILNAHNNNKIITHIILYIFYYIYSLHKIVLKCIFITFVCSTKLMNHRKVRQNYFMLKINHY